MNTKHNSKEVRNGWVIRAIDNWGQVFYRHALKGIGQAGRWDISLQNDEYNDLVPILEVFAKKEVADSKIPQTRNRLVELANKDGNPCRPVLPIRELKSVRYHVSIG